VRTEQRGEVRGNNADHPGKKKKHFGKVGKVWGVRPRQAVQNHLKKKRDQTRLGRHKAPKSCVVGGGGEKKKPRAKARKDNGTSLEDQLEGRPSKG